MSLLSALSNWGMSTSDDQQDDDAENAEGGAEGGADDAEDAEGSEDSEDGGDDEEEDEDEDEDIMPKIYEGMYAQHALTPDCEKSAPCAGALHHFEECQERLTSGKQLFEHEDCTEELYVT